MRVIFECVLQKCYMIKLQSAVLHIVVSDLSDHLFIFKLPDLLMEKQTKQLSLPDEFLICLSAFVLETTLLT